MDVDQIHFWPQLLPILRAISKATFVTFDLEMSGISTRERDKPSARPSDKPSLQQQYEETKEGAEIYQVLQVGITCVEEDREKNTYVARPYNFDVSPLFIEGDRLKINRDITFSTRNVQFLIGHSFNMGAIFTKGVPYLSREEETTSRQIFMESQDKLTKIPDLIIPPSDMEALGFYRKVRRTVSAFASQKKPELEFVNIIGPTGSLNGYQRRLVYQLIRTEFPQYRVFPRKNGEFMQVEKIDLEREAKIAKSKQQSFEAMLTKQIGLRFIFEALAGGDLKDINPNWFCVDENGEPAFADVDAKRREIYEIQKSLKKKTHLIVGHNLFTDLAFLYKMCVGSLPGEVWEFQRQIHCMFPQVIDTKYMFTHDNGSMHSNDRLRDIYDGLKLQTLPFILLDDKHTSYSGLGKEHEAGYDSWMTAKVFVKLAAKLDAERRAVLGFESEEEDDVSVQPAKLKRSCRFSTGTRFDQLEVEGDNDESPSGDPSSGKGIGAVFTGRTRPEREASLLDDDIPDGFKLVASRQAHLRPQAPDQSSSGFVARDSVQVSHDRIRAQSLLGQKETRDQTPDYLEYRQWIPAIRSSFWKNYTNKLRVNRIETGICDLNTS